MEARLFPEGTIPEYATPEWYAFRDAAPHLEQDGHRERLYMAAEFIHEITDPISSVADLGCGDGGLLSLLRANQPRLALQGWDLQQSNVRAARKRNIDVHLGDVVRKMQNGDTPFAANTDVIIATEMLEHLVDPHGFLKQLHDTKAPWLLASSPYTETAASHYEYHLWAWDILGYRYMLENAGWEVVRTGTAWICQVVLAKRVEV